MRLLLSAFCALFVLCLLIMPATAENAWFSSYDITDTEAVWDRLMQEITVLNVGEKEKVYLLDAPNGKKVFTDKMGGYIYGQSAAVHILGEDEGGWTLIEGFDDHDRLIHGYVKTKLLIQKKPNKEFGIVVDKLTQRMYIFKDGELFTELLISTGLVNDKQPYNETATGEYLAISWTGGFWSGNMWCDIAIRFNGGDLFHEVPCLFNADGSKNYKPYEPLLGTKASHGCIRVQRLKNPEGANMDWVWNNLKKNTKVLIWDDEGRVMPYPDDSMQLYYNPNNGQNYHAIEDCHGVKEKYLPLTGFTYSQLDDEPYADLTPCSYCMPPDRKEIIDQKNALLKTSE